MGRCKDCKYWGAHEPRLWAGGLTPPSKRRAAEQLDERDCLRVGGFASSGAFGPFGSIEFVDGDSWPRDRAYIAAHAARAELVTPPEFGCVQWEAK